MLISHIVSLYTKRDIIPTTLRSIMEQEGGYERELILVDDNSKDDTVEVARTATKGFPTQIITNTDNKGPSVRLNQGAKKAKGKYLHFLDHDDILPANALKIMVNLLEKTGADFVYGKWKITGKKPEELLGRRTDDHFNYTVSDKPLKTILRGKYKRMCVLVRREVFERAGGFDETIFIQDESLPLRLAVAANKVVVTDAIVNLVPKGEGNLSDNKSQLNHDRFMAYYNFYKKHKSRRIYRRAVSAAWKQRRNMGGKMAVSKYASYIFRLYMRSRKSPLHSQKSLDKLKEFFDSLPNIRKP